MWKTWKFPELSSKRFWTSKWKDASNQWGRANGTHCHLWTQNSIRYLLKISYNEFKKQVAFFFFFQVANIKARQMSLWSLTHKLVLFGKRTLQYFSCCIRETEDANRISLVLPPIYFFFLNHREIVLNLKHLFVILGKMYRFFWGSDMYLRNINSFHSNSNFKTFRN